jgi:wyosine [tRNA(Phe)-imidazoG37] synthetase (radical SAM superfamily)
VTCSLTSERDTYTEVKDVLSEFRQWTSEGGIADYVTFSGTGEPTLHMSIGEMILGIKKIGGPKVAVLTNGSLLHMSDVRRALAQADVVKVSLGAWDDDSLNRLNRPDEKLSFDRIYRGMREFRAEFKGELWLEVMIVAGVNDSDDAISRLAPLAKDICPERIDLNTVVRSPSDATALPVSKERLEEIAAQFDPKAEVIGEADVIVPEADIVGERRGTAFQ